MKEIKFKPITANQIEVKPTDTKSKNSCVLLLYIDSRSAADILNNTVGVFNWEIKYKDVAGQVYGGLSIYDEDRKTWCVKEDTGEESNIAEKKGQASDILKRCLARWGCDWLYHTPRIRIQTPPEYYNGDRLTMTFSVKEISFNENTKECTSLVVVDRYGKEVFNMANKETTVENKSISNKDKLIKFCKDTKPTLAEDKVEILNRFYKYYESKMDGWTGNFVPETLYKKWVERERNAA